MTTPDSFFGGAKGLSWPRANNGVYTDTALRGVIRGGLVVDDPVVQPITKRGTGEIERWPDGRAKEQLIVTLLCDGRGGAVDERRTSGQPNDDGRRRLYVKGYMVAAVREALQATSAPGIRQGGELYVAWVDEKPSGTKGNDPARVWAAKYVPPTIALPAGAPQGQPQQGLSGAPANPFGAQGAGAPAAAPAPQAPPQGQGAPASNPWGQPAPQQAPAAGPAHNPFG